MARLKIVVPRLAAILMLALSVVLAVPGGVTGHDAGASGAGAFVGWGTIARDHSIDPNQGGRHAASFKDGTFIRIVEVAPGNVIRIYSNENEVLYEDYGITGLNYSIQSIDVELSSFSGTVVFVFGGFTPDTGDSRTVTLVSGYRAQPEVHYTGTGTEIVPYRIGDEP